MPKNQLEAFCKRDIRNIVRFFTFSFLKFIHVFGKFTRRRLIRVIAVTEDMLITLWSSVFVGDPLLNEMGAL